MSVCVLVGAKTLTFAVAAFTLSWTHSVEKITWQEDWRVTADGLALTEARVRGSGAGMDPPPEAVFDGHWWRYQPDLPAIPEIVLARSGATVGPWSFCANGACQALPEPDHPADPLKIHACRP